MGKIKLSSGFQPIPEGTHIFKLTKVDYNEAYGKLEITMTTATGKNHIERFSLLKDNGKPNDGALNAFSFFAKTALNDFDCEEIDPQELVGHYMKCVVEHQQLESKNKPGTFITFEKLAEKEAASGYEGEDEEEEFVPVTKKGFDLDDLLG